MKKTMFLLLLVIFLSLIISVIAHQPRIVNSDGTNIIEPEISKAYYSNLDREPHYYYLNSDQEFNVYINVLIPGTELTHKVSAELSRNNEIIYFLDGENHDWEFFYEEFGKDYYLKGPEIGEDFNNFTAFSIFQFTDFVVHLNYFIGLDIRCFSCGRFIVDYTF